MTQKQMVIEYLDAFGSITPLDALREYSIMRLAAVVFELNRESKEACGEKLIACEIEKSVNKFGRPVRYARYSYDTSKITN